MECNNIFHLRSEKEETDEEASGWFPVYDR